MKYLVIDIETVVDPAIWSPPADDPDAFAPIPAWRPVCIGMVLLEATPAGLEVRKVGAIDEPDERTLLERFHETTARTDPAMVTWNGRGFDLPVLTLRALRYGFQLPWYFRTRGTRYTGQHVDLMDAMGDFGACRALGLDGMARLIGLPGKPRGADEVTGKNVAAAYAAGRIGEITAYCMADAVQTAFLWMRWELLRGTRAGVTLGWYRQAAGDLLRACEVDARLGGLVASVDRRVLLLERGEEAAA